MNVNNPVYFPLIGNVYSSDLPDEEIGNIAIDSLAQVSEAEWCCHWSAKLSNLRRGKIYGCDAVQTLYLTIKHLNFLVEDFETRLGPIKGD